MALGIRFIRVTPNKSSNLSNFFRQDLMQDLIADSITNLMLGGFSAMIEASHDPHLSIYAGICWGICFSLAMHWVLLVAPKSSSKTLPAQMQISSLDNTAPAL
jgi:hypothetical protein